MQKKLARPHPNGHSRDGSVGLDLLYMADFTSTGDLAFRLAAEVRLLAAAGHRIGLAQICRPAPCSAIADEIESCLRRGTARIVTPDEDIFAESLIIHQPARIEAACWPALQHPPIRGITVAHDTADLLAGVRDWPICPENGWSVFAVNATLRAAGRDRVRVMHRDWLPVVANTEKPTTPAGRSRAIGWLAGPGHAPAEIDAAVAALPADIEQFWLSGPEDAPAPGIARLPQLALNRLVRGLDVLVVAPGADGCGWPDMQVAAMLAAGRPVVAPDHMKAHYGAGPHYYAAGELPACVQAALAQACGQTAPRRAGFPGRCEKAPIHALIAPEAPAVKTPAERRRPVLALTANGVGIGHLTRLLAVSRRSTQPVVFASQVAALPFVRQFGFDAEYIPSAATVGGDFEVWDGWFKASLDRLIDAHDPTVVVYDGAHMSWGLVLAVARRPDCRLVWMRRGMWAATKSPFLVNARWCDLVIEPGELAADRDDGVTAARRAEALQVDPIRLLDRSDLLDRRDAAAELGLNPARPAVLVQLGSGYNRDLFSLLDQIIAALSQIEGLQIVVAEWVTGSLPLALWPHVTVLRGFPISRYLGAFDFCVSAAGYNSYHELIEHGVPTVFVANEHPSMDDQPGRAKFAQDQGAAFEISERDLHELPDLVALLMQSRARDYLADHCRTLQRPNGAAAAASALDALATRCQDED